MLVWASLAAVAVGVSGVSLLGYLVPPEARSGWHLNTKATPHFRAAVPGADRLPTITEAEFSRGFRASLVLAWGGYAGLLVGLSRGGAAPRGVVWVAAALPLFALPAPVYLTVDTYSYAADGRLYWLHGYNPVAVAPAAIPESADPVREVIGREVVHPYGPLWIAIECGVVGSLLWAGLVGQVVGFKLLAGVALIGAALAARSVTRRTAPGYADGAFVAVVAHPLLLIEGPGQGHNDLVMMALFAAAVALAVSGRLVWAGLALGLAAAVKLLPLAAVPWLAMAAWREAGWRRAGAVVLAALLPLPLLYLPFAEGARLADSLTGHSVERADPTVKQRDAESKARLEATGVPGPVAAVAVAVWGKRSLLVVYGAATAFVLLARRRPTAWVEAWVAFAAGLLFLVTGRAFPWYLAWMIVPAASGANRWAAPTVVFATVMGLLLAWRYTLVW